MFRNVKVKSGEYRCTGCDSPLEVGGELVGYTDLLTVALVPMSTDGSGLATYGLVHRIGECLRKVERANAPK